jgi:hypothetical protein
MFQTKCCREIQNTKSMFNNFFSFSKIVPFMRMWKNIVELDKPQMTMWRLCIAFWLPKSTNTHPEYVILAAFPLQRWLHRRPSMLRHTYIACLIIFSIYVQTDFGANTDSHSMCTGVPSREGGATGTWT